MLVYIHRYIDRNIRYNTKHTYLSDIWMQVRCKCGINRIRWDIDLTVENTSTRGSDILFMRISDHLDTLHYQSTQSMEHFIREYFITSVETKALHWS